MVRLMFTHKSESGEVVRQYGNTDPHARSPEHGRSGSVQMDQDEDEVVRDGSVVTVNSDTSTEVSESGGEKETLNEVSQVATLVDDVTRTIVDDESLDGYNGNRSMKNSLTLSTPSLASINESGALATKNEAPSSGLAGGSTECQATGEDLPSLKVGIEGDDPLPFSFNGGALEHPVSEMERVSAETTNGQATVAHESVHDGSEGLGLGDVGEAGSEVERIPASEDVDGMDFNGGVLETATVNLGQGDTEETGHEHPEPGAKQLSKSALKQLAKQERYKEIKMQRKAFEKEKRHEKTARKRKEWEEKLATLTEEEKEQARLEKLSFRRERKDEQISRKEKLRRALETGQNLVIDLEFGELMKPNEITSLIQQVMYSYAANGRAAVPSRMSLTGVTGDVRKELETIAGFNNWLLHKEEESYMEVFKDRQSDIVYLTADSETVLESLDITKVYVIGGLVDRNRWKNVTLEKATKQKIATAKLPIGDHMKMTASQVLTVNQVVELLLCFLDVGDWKESLLKVIPLRKRAAEDGVQGPGE